VLESWGYIEGWSLTDRGRHLARLYHESDLLVAECLEMGLLDGLDAAAVAGLVSCFTYEPRGPGAEPAAWFPSSVVRERWVAMDRLAEELASAEEEAGLPVSRPPQPGFLSLAWAWAAGQDLDDVMAEEEMSGGDFVRNVKQLIDLLRQVADVAPAPETAAVARQAADQLFRGVVAASSVVAVDAADQPAGP
jgi:ATP-dependent RNA helicase HelY